MRGMLFTCNKHKVNMEIYLHLSDQEQMIIYDLLQKKDTYVRKSDSWQYAIK